MVFALHQARATGHPSDGLFHQQQAILRTSPPPSTLMADYVKLWWSWRRRSRRTLTRSLFHFLLTAMCAVGFVAVSILTSSIVTTTDLEVLVRSHLCGSYNTGITTNLQRSLVATLQSIAIPYGQECYGSNTILPARCKAFIRPSIPFRTEGAQCPFTPEFCTETEGGFSPAVAFDSGLIDLNDGFGFNLPSHDRVSYRRRSTCTVLPLAGHATVSNASDIPFEIWQRNTFPGEEAFRLHYGDRPALGKFRNLTFFKSLLDANMTEGFDTG
jgi:hypothetical protein